VPLAFRDPALHSLSAPIADEETYLAELNRGRHREIDLHARVVALARSGCSEAVTMAERCCDRLAALDAMAAASHARLRRMRAAGLRYRRAVERCRRLELALARAVRRRPLVAVRLRGPRRRSARARRPRARRARQCRDREGADHAECPR
jgi:hypothetical protein